MKDSIDFNPVEAD